MKIIGIVFIMASAITSGFRVSTVLKKRCAYLRHLMHALQMLKNELLFSAKPLPKVFSVLSKAAQGSVGELFSELSSQMENNRWMTLKTAMERTLANYVDDPSDEIMLGLASDMSSYDLDAQIRAIDMAVIRVQHLLGEMESECGVKSKTYKTLSICAGLATVILLL